MTQETQVEQGRKELERILNVELATAQDVRNEAVRYWKEKVPPNYRSTSAGPGKEFNNLDEAELDLKNCGALIYIRKSQPWFVGAGMHQAVIEVGNGLAAKLPANEHPTTQLEKNISSSFPDFVSVGYGRYNYRFMKETMEILQDLGHEVPVGEFYHVGWNEAGAIAVTSKFHQDGFRNRKKSEFPPPNVFVTVDLRENGRYNVVEYDEAEAITLPNGNNLIRDYRKGYDKLRKLYVDSMVGIFEGVQGKEPPYLVRKPHGSDKSPETAIRKMFFLQIPADKSREGKLVLGDLDHTYLMR